MLKALFIGGTGIISSGITRALAENADVITPNLTEAGDGGSGKRQGLNRRYRQQRDCGKAVGGTAFPRGGGFYRFYTGAGKAGFRLFPGKMRPVFLYRNRVGVSKAVDEPGDYGKHSDEKSLLAVFQRQNRLRGAADGGKPEQRLSGDNRSALPCLL